MKISICIVCICAFSTSTFSQYYYYYFNQKIPLTINTDYIYIATKSTTEKTKLSTIIGTNYEIVASGIDNTPGHVHHLDEEKQKQPIIFRAKIKLKSGLRVDEYMEIIKQLKNIPDISYAAPCFGDRRNAIDISHLFYVKLKSQDDIALLKDMAQQTKAKIIGQNRFMPLWFTLTCDKNATGNALELANQFYESGQFSTASPDFFNHFKLQTCSPPNDSLLSDQWGLINTGQSGGTAGVDINVCPAWGITTGSPSIITAIIDGGFQRNHPDLEANVPNAGFDASGSGPNDTSVIHTNGSGCPCSFCFTCNNEPDHATMCAGIVAAVQNNTIGISGVAPTSSIISVSIDFNSTTDQILADAINWAWDTGHASILSCSWGLSPLDPPSIVTDAIDTALIRGRGGLGSVLVFASGNDDDLSTFTVLNQDDIIYPADLCTFSNTTPSPISVGGIDRCGARSGSSDEIPNSCDPWVGSQSGSDYGRVAVCAPGTNVTTTCRIGQGTGGIDYMTGNGTSFACPYVSGVAALILSANPCLTNTQVANLIEKTCQKVDTTEYSTFTPIPNGTWNEFHGYGLVNAFAAVNLANAMYLQNITETNDSHYFDSIIAGNDVTNFEEQGDYIVPSGVSDTLKAVHYIRMEPGFIADVGSVFLATIATTNTDCSNWSTPTIFGKTNFFNTNVVNTDTTTSIYSLQDSNNIVVYPNPTSDYLNIAFSVNTSQTIKMTLTDLYGRVLYTARGDREPGQYVEKITNLSRYANEILFLSVCRGNSDCNTFKILKIGSY